MEVDESLHRITAWCNRHAPATAAAIRPPASADVLSTVQATTGRRWPDDLVAFYGSCDGTERTPAGYLFPGYCPDPLSDVGRHWTRWQTSWAGVVIALEDDETDQEERRVRRALGAGPVTEIYDLDRLMAEPAGATASRFLPAFVPFAEDQSGDDLFVDTRSGPQHGCVTEYLKGRRRQPRPALAVRDGDAGRGGARARQRRTRRLLAADRRERPAALGRPVGCSQLPAWPPRCWPAAAVTPASLGQRNRTVPQRPRTAPAARRARYPALKPSPQPRQAPSGAPRRADDGHRVPGPAGAEIVDLGPPISGNWQFGISFRPSAGVRGRVS